MTQRKAAGDRRDEIRQVALELFTEHGYEATSMRQIAEHLEITKAALYYHFDSKEAIVRSLFEDRLRALDELVARAEQEPYSAERTARIVAGCFGVYLNGGLGFARFAIANHAIMRELAPSPEGALDRLQKISELLADAGMSASEQLRIRMAMMSMNLAVMASHGLDLTDAELLAAAIETAQLIAPGYPIAEFAAAPAAHR